MKKFHQISFFILLLLSSCGGNNTSSLEASLKSTIYNSHQLVHANESEYDRGSSYYEDLKYELEFNSKGTELVSKREKLSKMLAHVDSIEQSCSKLISIIEDIKIELLKKETENVKTIKNYDSNTIIWRKYDPQQGCLPSKLNLLAVKSPESSAIVNSVLVAENHHLTKNGSGLWQGLIDYRRVIVNHTGSYSWGEKSYVINVKPINDFADRDELLSKTTLMVDKSQANLKEDRQVLIDLYVNLTKPAFIKQNDVKIHWMNATFTDLPIVSAIASLSSLQNEILRARTLAYMNWKSKMGHCCNSFNQIIPFAVGPSTVTEGENIEIKVAIVAFDSDKQPKVTIKGYESEIEYENGLGIVKLKPKKGLQTIRGTVSTKNNSGLIRTEEWEWTVNVLEKLTNSIQ